MRGGDLTSVELVECNLENARLELSTLDKATIKDCKLIGAYLNATNSRGAFIQSGDWSNIDLHRSDLTDTVIENVCLKIARFQGARLHRATITNCNFQTANLVAATAHDTVFNHCDFRNANKRRVYYKEYQILQMWIL